MHHHQQHAPVQQPQASGGMMSGLGSTVMQGMAFGAGSEIAHQAVRGIMGSGGSSHSAPQEQQQVQMAPPQQVQYAQPANQAQQNPCQSFNQSFLSCLK